MFIRWIDAIYDDSVKSALWKDLVNFYEAPATRYTSRGVTRTKLRGVIGLLKQSGVVSSTRDPSEAQVR